MIQRRPYLRSLLIALVALAGIPLGMDGAPACASMDRADAECASACGCCVVSVAAVDAPSTGTIAANLVGVWVSDADFSLPPSPCSCRAQQPLDPTPAPVKGESKTRLHIEPLERLDSASVIPCAMTLLPRPRPTALPSPSPLYLRFARLLI